MKQLIRVKIIANQVRSFHVFAGLSFPSITNVARKGIWQSLLHLTGPSSLVHLAVSCTYGFFSSSCTPPSIHYPGLHQAGPRTIA
jgi:hypothetical protein